MTTVSATGSGGNGGHVPLLDTEILSRLPGGVIIVVDPADMAVRYVSPSVERTLGFTAEEYAAEMGFRQVHPDDRTAVSEAVDKIRAEPGTEWRDEVRIRHADGTWRWVEYLMVNHLDEPTVAGIVSEFRDIHDRKVAEEALRVSEERFRTLVATSSDIVVVGGGDRTLQYVSPSVESVLGWTPAEFGRRFPKEILHPDEYQFAHRHSKSLRSETAGRRKGLIRLLHKDGSWRWMESTSTNLLDHPDVAGVVTNFRDVNDRIEAEQALLRSEERFRALLEHSTEAVLTIDANARVTFATQAAARLLGQQTEELIGTEGLDLVHPEDHETVATSLQAIIDGPGPSFDLTVRIRRADGEYRWMEGRATNLLDDPAVAGVVVNFRDVTERRRTEAALAASEGRFRALIQNSPVAVVLVDAEANVTWASPMITRMLGYLPREVVGTPAFDLLHDDDRERVAANLARLVDGETELPTVIVRVRHRDGSWRWIDITGTNLLDDAPVNAVLVNLRDMQEQVEAQSALRASEERFRALVQHSSDVVVIADADGTVAYVGPAVEQMFGFAPVDLLGRSISEFGHPDEDEEGAASWMALLAEPGRSVQRISRLRRQDGDWRTVESSMVNLLDNPAVGGIVININDITDRVRAEQALADSEARFRTVLEYSSDITAVMGPDSNISWISPNVEPIFGFRVDEMIGQPGHEWLHPDDMDESLDRLARMVDGEEIAFPHTVRLRHADGSWHWVDLVASNLLDNTDVGGIVINVRDITSRIGAEIERDRLTSIIEATTDLVAVTDRQGKVVYVNEASRRFFGIEPGQEAAFDYGAHTPDWAQRKYALETIPALKEHDLWSGELAFLQGEREVPVSTVFMAHRNDAGELETVSSVIRDISERKVLEAALEHEATHDPLTGLPNRALLLDRLGVALSRAHRFGTALAVLFLDLDHFKVVNDSLGHTLGDKLLKSTSERLKEALREGGDTVARFGGDEFVILCEDLSSRDDAMRIADRVEELLSQPFVLDDTEVFVTVSIGIAFSDGTRPGSPPDDLIRDADAAMYRAKERGRNRFELFDQQMREQAVDRLGLESSLRRAVDRHELRVHYQPQVDLKSGFIMGAEALVRWEHPEKGLLLPGEFMRVAEETGLIVPIGKWVMEQAIRQVQRWQAEQPDLPPLFMCINLSGRQLNHPGLIDEVAEILADTGIDPSLVDFEITETELAKDLDLAFQCLSALKELGVKIVVDDFGTGYSSLSNLHDFPVDLLKIDQSFVAGLGVSKGDTAIVTAVISLAHALDLQVIGEGVETAEQLTELRRLGCDHAQGFYLARPQPEHAVAELLAQYPTY